MIAVSINFINRQSFMETPGASSVQMTEIIMPTALGFHLRVVAKFVKCVSQFHSVILVRKGNMKANGKSILGLLLLAAARKSKLHIEAEGDDAKQAIECIKSFFQSEKTQRTHVAGLRTKKII